MRPGPWNGGQGLPFHAGRFRRCVQHVHGIQGRFRFVPVPSPDNVELVSRTDEGGFRHGPGKGWELFHGPVRPDQQGVLPNALFIVASGQHHALADTGACRVAQRNGQIADFIPLPVREFKNVPVVRLRAAFLRGGGPGGGMGKIGPSRGDNGLGAVFFRHGSGNHSSASRGIGQVRNAAGGMDVHGKGCVGGRDRHQHHAGEGSAPCFGEPVQVM